MSYRVETTGSSSRTSRASVVEFINSFSGLLDRAGLDGVEIFGRLFGQNNLDRSSSENIHFTKDDGHVGSGGCLHYPPFSPNVLTRDVMSNQGPWRGNLVAGGVARQQGSDSDPS